MAETVQLEEKSVEETNQMIFNLLDLVHVMMRLITVSCWKRLLLSVMEPSIVLTTFQQLHSLKIVMASEGKSRLIILVVIIPEI